MGLGTGLRGRLLRVGLRVRDRLKVRDRLRVRVRDRLKRPPG